MRMITAVTAGALLAGPVFGAGVARADSPEEQQACQLMDDPAAAEQGLAPAE